MKLNNLLPVNPSLSYQQSSLSGKHGDKEEIHEVEEVYKDNSKYIGQKVNGIRHGKGKFVYSDGGVYDGEWKYGSMDGYGKLYYPNEKLAYDG